MNLENSATQQLSKMSMTRFSQNSRIIEHLDLTNFKTHPCSNQAPHNHKQCRFYHCLKVSCFIFSELLKDQRRPGDSYSSEMCDSPNQCFENCPKSHNKVEQLYKVDKYKKKFCTFYPNRCDECEYGEYCSFAHSEIDIQTELIHHLEYDFDFYIFYFKTVWCPYNYINHDRANCVYAHNWQDFRRKPQNFDFEPITCHEWKPNDFVLKYENGCRSQFNCDKCHGWKEFEYHPKIYKTRPCQSGQNCLKGNQCSFYHSIHDKRIINEFIQNNILKLIPRNRIINGIFKLNQNTIYEETKKQKIQTEFNLFARIRLSRLKSDTANNDKKESNHIIQNTVEQ